MTRGGGQAMRQQGHGQAARRMGAAAVGVAGVAGAAAMINHGHGNDHGGFNAANVNGGVNGGFNGGPGRGQGFAAQGAREMAVRQYGDGRGWMAYRDARSFSDGSRPGWSPLVMGCPPGLAKKNDGCTPPGQLRPIWGYSDPWANWYTYPQWYGWDPGYDWRYGDGYLYRVDRTTMLVSAFLPLLGGALWDGQVWPSDYTDYGVDPYYGRYYGYDGGDWDYRYGDGAVFAVDRRSNRIDHVVALLTGDRWAVGQRIPDGYEVYNIPPEYRDRYFDGPDVMYRYSDGYVYEVDPNTLLIRKVLELLANG